MSALIAVLLGCIWKHSVHGQPRRILSFVVAKDADWDLALKKKNMIGRSCHGGTVPCCVAGCDTNCMDKFFVYTLNTPCETEAVLDP